MSGVGVSVSVRGMVNKCLWQLDGSELGGVAQMVERSLSMRQVVRSMLTTSTTNGSINQAPVHGELFFCLFFWMFFWDVFVDVFF